MSEADDTGDLTPEEQAEYAALLAGLLPAEEPLPAEVAERLDRRLEELSAERTSSGPGMGGAAAVRRRRFGGVLLAAAAVTVGGFAVTTVAGGEDSGDAMTAADGGAESDDGVDQGAQDSAGGSADDGEPESAGVAALSEALPRVRRGSVERDVTRLVDGGRMALALTDGVVPEEQRSAPDPDSPDNTRGEAELDARDVEGLCALPTLEEGETWLLVRYAGDVVVLVAEPADADPPREARLFPCGGGEALVTVELPGDSDRADSDPGDSDPGDR